MERWDRRVLSGDDEGDGNRRSLVTFRSGMLFGCLWLVVAAVFAYMSVEARDHSRFPGDLAVTSAVQRVSFPALQPLEEAADLLGSPPFLLLATGLLGLAFYRSGHYYLVGVAGSVVVARASGLLFKELVERPRPHGYGVVVRESPGGYSFPSGHALGAALLLGLVLVASQRYLTGWRRAAVQAAAIACGLLIGAERIYDGAHWPSDVIGGFLLGLLLMSATVMLARRCDWLARRHLFA